jgi:hypothetical protein
VQREGRHAHADQGERESQHTACTSGFRIGLTLIVSDRAAAASLNFCSSLSIYIYSLFSFRFLTVLPFHSQADKLGYIFGAFTAVSWPKPTEKYATVADPSGSSFLFSLTNEYQRPFRMSLKDKSRSISLDDFNGPCFGGEEEDAAGKWIKFCNLMLMYGGRDARREDGCCAIPQNDATYAYRLDDWNQDEPLGFKLDETTFAGSQYFAAAEIEVYSL